MLELRSLPLMRRFISKTKMAENGCVEWQGTRTPGGYGVLRINKKGYLAHRLSCCWANSQELPKGMWVCHACDNPSCVNPEHLWLGTPNDNWRDSVNKGRSHIPTGYLHHRGEGNPRSKLTLDTVNEIRKRVLAGARNMEIVKAYGITNWHVWAIKSGKIWS